MGYIGLLDLSALDLAECPAWSWGHGVEAELPECLGSPTRTQLSELVRPEPDDEGDLEDESEPLFKWREIASLSPAAAVAATGTRGVTCVVSPSTLVLFDMEEDEEEEDDEDDEEGSDYEEDGEADEDQSSADQEDGEVCSAMDEDQDTRGVAM